MYDKKKFDITHDLYLPLPLTNCHDVLDLLLESDILYGQFDDPLCQWCTTSGPRATSGLRRVLMWPTVSNKKSDYFKPRHLVYSNSV